MVPRDSRLSRRQFIRHAGLAVVSIGAAPSLLAACGDGTAATTTAAGATTTMAGGTTAPAGSLGAVDYLSWEGYDLPIESMDAWRAANGVTSNPTYIANHDEIQAKLVAGGDTAGYDLITYYQGYKPLYTELDILTPLDEEQLPNLAGLFEFWGSDIDNFWINADGTRTGVPFTWGSIGLTYDSAQVDEMSSWFDLLDPSLEGRISMPDDPAGLFNLTCKILGLDPAAAPKAELDNVVDTLGMFVAHANSVSPSFGDMTTKLVAGDIVACFHGWAAMNTFAAGEGLDTVRTNIPEEGSHTFCDSYAIPPSTDNPEAAHAWINESLTPEANAEAAIYLVGGVTVEEAVPLLDESTAQLYPYEDLDALLELAPLFSNAPSESDEFITFPEWTERWQELKAGAAG